MYFYKKFIQNYVNFKGRASREEFWTVFGIHIVISSILFLLFEERAFIYNAFVFLPFLSLSVRRLHDLGKNWTTLFLSLIPIIGGIWLFILYLKQGEKKENKWGKPVTKG